MFKHLLTISMLLLTPGSAAFAAGQNPDPPTVPQESQSAFENVNDPELLKIVPTTNWVYAATDYMQRKKILLGYPRNWFNGVTPRTRYEFVVAVSRAIYAALPTETPVDMGINGWSEPGSITPFQTKLMRKLHLEFKKYLKIKGKTWKQVDDYFLGLQERYLQISMNFVVTSDTHGHESGQLILPEDTIWSELCLPNLKKLLSIDVSQGLTWRELAARVHQSDNKMLSVVEHSRWPQSQVDLAGYSVEDIVSLNNITRVCTTYMANLSVDIQILNARFNTLIKRVKQHEETITKETKLDFEREG